MDTLHTHISVTSYGHPTHISVTCYGHPTQNSVTSYGHPSLISVTIGTRILKLKLKRRLKIKFFTNFTVLIMILRSFYTIYVEISVHWIIPLSLTIITTIFCVFIPVTGGCRFVPSQSRQEDLLGYSKFIFLFGSSTKKCYPVCYSGYSSFNSSCSLVIIITVIAETFLALFFHISGDFSISTFLKKRLKTTRRKSYKCFQLA